MTNHAKPPRWRLRTLIEGEPCLDLARDMEHATDDKAVGLDPVEDPVATMPAGSYTSGKLLGYRVHFGIFA